MNVVKSQCNNTPPPLLLLQRLLAPQPSCNYYWHLTLLTGAFAELRIAAISFVMSVRPSVCLSAWNNSVPTGRIFIKFDIWAFSENLSIKFKFHWNPTRVTGSLDGDVFTYITISRWILLRIRNVSNKSHRENKNVHFMSNNFFVENRPIYEMSKNVKLERPQMTLWRRIACWISKATRAQSRDRSPVVSLGIFFPRLPTEPCALGSTQPLNMSTRKIPGSKAGWYVRLTTYHLLVPNVKKIRGLNLPDLPWACSGL
jgi:hypothetical protein